MANAFTDLTQEGLGIPSSNPRLAPRGFEVYDNINDNENEHVILIIGLNPAGDDKVARLEETSSMPYLYYIDSASKMKSNWLYNLYYKPIYTFADAIYEGDVKWPWCNKKWCGLDDEIIKSGLDDLLLKDIKEWYDKHRSHAHTIYVGDMFYYHETKSAKLPLQKGYDYSKYCREMLKLHIDTLTSHGKTIDFIYINNAQVSHWLCGGKNKTYEQIANEYVFYGPMLSGAHAIDSFSRARLIQEIKTELKLI